MKEIQNPSIIGTENQGYSVKLSFDEYKKNLLALEKKISDGAVLFISIYFVIIAIWFSHVLLLQSIDNEDPSHDVETAKSWIEYIERPDTTLEEINFFLQDAFPKFIKAILNRKYDVKNLKSYQSVLFLEYSSLILGRILPKCSETNESKFQMQKNEHGGNNLVGQNVMLGLEKGAVIDCYNKLTGKWELAIVESFSDFKTEFEVCWPDDKRDWLSLEEVNRVAPFGTKTGLIEMEVINDEKNHPEETELISTGDVAAIVSDSTWKSLICVGDLVDARDKNDVWCQACILELETRSLSTLCTPVIVPLTIKCDSSTAENVAVVIDTNNDSTIDMDVSPDVATTDKNCDEKADQIDEESHAQVFVNKMFARISFIGFPDRYDEWIELESDRIEQFNKYSFGKRGDSNVREEILFLVNLKPAHGEIDNFAVYREGSFVDPVYVNIVNAFGKGGGFDNTLQLLNRSTSSEPSQVSLQSIFSLIIAIGNMHKVLTKSFLASFGMSFLEFSVNILRSMTLSDVRETSTETMEYVLNALESIAIMHFGRNAATGEIIEPLRLEISLRTLSSPFLNRRLGGLKILTDLIRRAEAVEDVPTGLKVTKLSSNNVETVSYRVVPILYHLTIGDICSILQQNNKTLTSIFEGGTAHESLMARVSTILSAMAAQNILNNELVDSIWNAGLIDKNNEAFRCLVDITACLNPNSIFRLLQKSVDEMDGKLITTSLVDILGAIGTRCKLLMVSKDCNENISHFMEKSVKLLSQTITMGEFDFEDDESSKHAIFYIYHKSLAQLWQWLSDGSSVSENVVSRCLEKFENIVELGTSYLSALGEPNFPWAMHWYRMKNVVELSINSIKQGTSIVASLKIIQLCMQSWPFKTTVAVSNVKNVRNLPFNNPSRSEFVNFLEAQYTVMPILTQAITRLKRSVDQTIHQNKNINVLELKIMGSRHTYKEELDKCLDFFHIYVKSSDSLFIPQGTIEDVWNAIIISNPLVVEECDSVISFCSKIVVKTVDSSSSNDNDSTSAINNSMSSLSEKIITGSRRNAVCSRETIEWVFIHLMCENISSDSNRMVNSFIRSPHYNLKAFNCFEKWFRWLNAECGFIIESRDKNSPFIIETNPSKLIGFEFLPDLILNCQLDVVASNAVKFLSSFPQYLSLKLQKSDEIFAFRSSLLLRCMKELEVSFASSEVVNVNRVLMLLDGILEESLSNSSIRVVPHGTVGKGSPIEFKINSSNKKFKKYAASIILFTNDSQGDLVNAIAEQFQTSVSEIKVFRQGKEISVVDFKKSIGQLKQLGPKDSVVVAEKPPAVIAKEKEKLALDKLSVRVNSDNTTSPVASIPFTSIELPSSLIDLPIIASFESNSEDKSNISRLESENDCVAALEDYENERNKLPAVILSDTVSYFNLLFDLLQNSEGDVCDKIWSLIIRLPTSGPLQLEWLKLNPNISIIDFFFSFGRGLEPDAFHKLSKLVYNLQIIEVFLEPANSMNDFEKQKAYITDLDHELLLSWVDRFIKQGGFQCICAAYEWIVKCFEYYVNSKFMVKGVTPNMLIYALSLSSKMMKAFLARIVVSNCISINSSNSSSSPFAEVKIVLNQIINHKKIIDLSNSEKDEGASVVIEDIDGPTDEVTKSHSDTVALPINDKFSNQLLSGEWGWRISLQLLKKEHQIDVAHIQFLTVYCMQLLHKLSNHPIFGLPSVSAIDKSKLLTNEDNILSMMDSLLVIWGCVVFSSPNVLRWFIRDANIANSGVDFIDTNVIVTELLLSEYDIGLSLNFKLAGKISNWFVSALIVIIKWSTSLESISGYMNMFLTPNNPVEGNLSSELNDMTSSSQLCSQLFLSLLDNRPSLVNPISSQMDDANDAQFKTKPLFTLAAAILDNCSGATIAAAIPIDVRRNACKQIIVELKGVSQLLMIDKSLKFPLIEGTMKLFSSLIIGCGGALDGSETDSNDVDNSILNKAPIEFLLTKCLGLMDLDSCTEPIICTDESSRKHCFAIVQQMCGDRLKTIGSLINSLNLIHQFVPVPPSWDYKPDRDSISLTGYVGLRNLGSTCYMNSLIQVLYMNNNIREFILNDLSLILNQSEDSIRNDLLFQLQKMFNYLKYSKKKYFSPTDWAFAFKDHTGVNPINVMQQQDAQEFLQLLCERFEGAISSYKSCLESNGSKQKPVDILSQTFGGKLCNQMFKSNSSDIANKHNIREQEESFVCISLQVKDCRDLQFSLAKFVEGEQISDYQWEEGAKRENITKRQCISELPDTLIFHLKRFELNFDTFRREKVNDSFPFPVELNMLPYTKEGLSHDTESYKAQGYYDYELAGVVVHTGTTDSGHYFCYLKEMSLDDFGQSGQFARWFEFNDSEVTPFHESKLEAECFGGVTITHQLVSSSNEFFPSETVNPKSAYMLVYRRKKPSPFLSNAGDTIQQQRIMDSIESTDLIGEILKQIEQENSKHFLSIRIHSSSYIQFYCSLVESYFKALNYNSNPLLMPVHVLVDAFFFCAQHVAKTPFTDLFVQFTDKVARYLHSHSPFTNSNTNNCSLISEALLPTAIPARDYFILSSKKPQRDDDTSHLHVNTNSTFIRANQLILSELLKDFDTQVVRVLLSNKEEIRTEYGHLLFRLFDMSYTQESSSSFSQSGLNMSNGSIIDNSYSGQNNNGASSHLSAIPEAIDDEYDFDNDPELALAIKMSKAGYEKSESKVEAIDNGVAESKTVESKSLSGVVDESSLFGQYDCLSARFLYELTNTHRMNSLAENWKKSKAYVDLLRSISRCGFYARDFMIRRSVVCELIDIYLGDVSPLLGSLYTKGSRKRAPTSYVIYPISRPCIPPPNSTKNIPDWTSLLELLSVLICSCKNQFQLNAISLQHNSIFNINYFTGQTSVNQDHLTNSSSLSSFDWECVKLKVLYSTILHQARYINSFIGIMHHLCYEDAGITGMFAEVLHEELALSTAETTAHIFEAIEKFCSISDSLRFKRLNLLFGATPTDLLLLASGMVAQPLKTKFVFVFIRSFINLVRVVQDVEHFVSKPLTKIESWASWMLKFSFRFQTKHLNEQTPKQDLASLQGQINQAIIESQGSVSQSQSVVIGPQLPNHFDVPNASSHQRGPFIIVYGEAESDHDAPWRVRAETLFSNLSEMIRRMGINPDGLIPDDTFVDLPEGGSNDSTSGMPPLISGVNSNLNDIDTEDFSRKIANDSSPLFSGDVLTDEDFEKYLALQRESANATNLGDLD
eukprot:gene10058-13518_t